MTPKPRTLDFVDVTSLSLEAVVEVTGFPDKPLGSSFLEDPGLEILGVVNLGEIENLLVFGVDVTNSSVNRFCSVVLVVVLLVGALGDVFLLNRADSLSLALLSFGLNRPGLKDFFVDELSVVDGRKEWFLRMDSLLWGFVVDR